MTDVRTLLNDCGIPEARLDEHSDQPIEFAGFCSPEAVEELGQLLADDLGRLRPTHVLVLSADDTVLGHVVARRLGTPGLLAGEDAGILWLRGTLPVGGRVVIVASHVDAGSRLEGIMNMIGGRGGEVVGVGVLVSSPALRSAAPEANALLDTGGTT